MPIVPLDHKSGSWHETKLHDSCSASDYQSRYVSLTELNVLYLLPPVRKLPRNVHIADKRSDRRSRLRFRRSNQNKQPPLSPSPYPVCGSDSQAFGMPSSACPSALAVTVSHPVGLPVLLRRIPSTLPLLAAATFGNSSALQSRTPRTRW